MHRRDFLIAAAGVIGACSSDLPVSASTTATAFPDAMARDFAHVDRAKLQFAGFLLGTPPRPVREAIERHRRELDHDTATYLYANNRRLETETRVEAGKALGVEPESIALTDSTTLGLGLVYGLIDVRPDQEVLTTTHDHTSTHEALRLRAARTGTTVRKVPLYRNIATVTEGGLVAAVKDAIRPNTRVLAVTWVHSSTGLRLPIPAIAAAVAELNMGRAPADALLLVVDGVHGFCVEDISLPDLGCDVFVSGTHKWLCGPRGTGLVWANLRGQAALTPMIPTFSRGAGWGGAMSPGGFHAFEHRWALADAFRWRAAVGPAAICEHVHTLARRLNEGLRAIPGITVATPLDEALCAGIVSFDVTGRKPSSVDRLLRARSVVAVHAPYERSFARLAPMPYTTAAEVDEALAVVASIVPG